MSGIAALALTLVCTGSAKVAQISGDFDKERRSPTVSQTASRFGVLGTDLGASFEHEGKLVFLFGDTWPKSGPHPSRPFDGDAVALSIDTDPDRGLRLEFVTSEDGLYRSPQIPDVSLGAFEVPTGGFSFEGHMYAFFTTSVRHKERGVVMAESVLARSRDGASWQLVRRFSTEKFVNVSPWVVEASEVPGLPVKSGPAVLLFASGKEYRRSHPFLACMPLGSEAGGDAVRYWSETEGWTTSEAKATPLFDHPHMGEISVAWCEQLRRWLMLYNSPTPRGIHARIASSPWGPWSEPTLVFDPKEGYGRFMHVDWRVMNADKVHDPGRENEWGGEYGPYMIPRFFRRLGSGVRIYFVMSTWNPYQVVLMRADLNLRPLESYPLSPPAAIPSTK